MVMEKERPKVNPNFLACIIKGVRVLFIATVNTGN